MGSEGFAMDLEVMCIRRFWFIGHRIYFRALIDCTRRQVSLDWDRAGAPQATGGDLHLSAGEMAFCWQQGRPRFMVGQLVSIDDARLKAALLNRIEPRTQSANGSV